MIFVSGRCAGSQSTTQIHYLCTIVYWRIQERRDSLPNENILTCPALVRIELIKIVPFVWILYDVYVELRKYGRGK